ncbi:MAG: DoxX family membrane protein, partial [Planctomycetes bacterium]|nr:DoxX family membrane protein [Planctomycetota bacterium]
MPEKMLKSELGQGGHRFWRENWSIWFERLVRWPLALLFLWAGVNKLSDPDAFVLLIDAFGILPDRALKPTAIWLPLFEIAVSLGLLSG